MNLHPTHIVAVRHGQTDWNRENRIQGYTDIALNAHGHWQAEQLALALREEDFGAFYASDLSRARQTAQAVATRHAGGQVRQHEGLRERCLGAFEGHTWEQVQTRWPQEAAAWRERAPDFAPVGAESLLALQARVLGTVNTLAALHPGEQVLMVVHGGVLDILYRAATGTDMQTRRTWDLTNTAINRLLWTAPGHLSLLSWSDVRHLHTEPGPVPGQPAGQK